MLYLTELLGEAICGVLQLLLVVALGLAIRRAAKYLAPAPSPQLLPPGKDIFSDN